MQLGWVDFSKDERNKVLNVIHLLDEPGAVDELGLGVIRDAFANYFFPGTSTVQTRAKYFLIVPYVLKEAGSGMYGNDFNSIIRKIDKEEQECRDILIKSSTDGVIGSLDPNSWVLRTPSNIYWAGIKKIGIFNNENLSIYEYIRQSINQRLVKQAKNFGNREKDAEENEKDDVDAGDITSFQFWSLGDTYRKEWKKDLTIDLLPQEASFLKEQIIKSQGESLFAYILKNEVTLDKYDTFAALYVGLGNSVGSELKYMMKLANEFNNLVSLLTTRYNLIVSQEKNKDAIECWNKLSKEIIKKSGVDLLAIFEKLYIKRNKLERFLINIQKAFREGDINKIDEIIVNREVDLKGNRAKTKRAGEYEKWIGVFNFDYRYYSAKRIINDIVKAEGEKHV